MENTERKKRKRTVRKGTRVICEKYHKREKAIVNNIDETKGEVLLRYIDCREDKRAKIDECVIV